MNVGVLLILVGCNSWANARILQLTARLKVLELETPLGLSGDSILGTLVHILDTQ